MEIAPRQLPDEGLPACRRSVRGVHRLGGVDRLSWRDTAEVQIRGQPGGAIGDQIVVCLLGDGYGTGEYSMYGSVTVDLTTGTLTDDPAVSLPPGVTFD